MIVYQQQCLFAYLGHSPGALDGLVGSNTAPSQYRRLNHIWQQQRLQERFTIGIESPNGLFTLT